METEARTQAVGRALLEEAQKAPSGPTQPFAWERQVLSWCMQDASLKPQILRFVDVFPSLATARSVIQHLRTYFPDRHQRLPLPLRLGLAVTGPSALTGPAIAAVTRQTVQRMARLFIAGETLIDAKAVLEQMVNEGLQITLDPLGETVTSESEAESYLQRTVKLIHDLSALSKLHPTLTPHISIKLSSLDPHFDPIAPRRSIETVGRRLGQIFRQAELLGVFINIDMERYETRDLTYQSVRALIDHQFPKMTRFGLVVQAYLRDSDLFLNKLIGWARDRNAPFTIRLVKGAYWDTEVVLARQRGWPIPVFTQKEETDQRFEELTKRLLENAGTVTPAIATHNVRSMAHALAVAESLTTGSNGWEMQILYGMAETLKTALAKRRCPVRVYAPIGPLIPGMAYLVRRLLENSSNESFVRHQALHDLSADDLLRPPHPAPALETTSVQSEPFTNEPDTDFSKEQSRQDMLQAIEKVRSGLGQRSPLIIGKSRLTTDLWMIHRNPSHPKEIIGHVAKGEKQHIEMAVKAAEEAFAGWSRITASGRAEILRRAAGQMRQQRFEFAALEILEAGKTWREADTDVSEAIDAIVYYSAQAEELIKPHALTSPSGERNQLFYEPLGVGAIIAPWNFPLAIPVGMTSAAILSGNTIVLKPAEQSSIVVRQWVELLLACGLPPGVVNCVSGIGKEIGPLLTRHPKIRFVGFTGSKNVGLEIISAAGTRRVTAEMGGKNAIIVDEDADLDDAVVGIVASAFGHQGQKCSACSRLIIVGEITDLLTQRLVEAIRSLKLGPAEDPETQIGPLIDEPARSRVLRAIAQGEREARVLLKIGVPKELEGYHVGPTLFTDVPPHATIAQEEIFGPVLCIFRVKTIEEAWQLANATEYGLTAGIYSRHPAHLAGVEKNLEAGNIYLNRKITGAIVGRQPFGGGKSSGTGWKAGGPDSLKEFLQQKVVSENTLRHGSDL